MTPIMLTTISGATWRVGLAELPGRERVVECPRPDEESLPLLRAQ